MARRCCGLKELSGCLWPVSSGQLGRPEASKSVFWCSERRDPHRQPPRLFDDAGSNVFLRCDVQAMGVHWILEREKAYLKDPVS